MNRSKCSYHLVVHPGFCVKHDGFVLESKAPLHSHVISAPAIVDYIDHLVVRGGAIRHGVADCRLSKVFEGNAGSDAFESYRSCSFYVDGLEPRAGRPVGH